MGGERPLGVGYGGNFSLLGGYGSDGAPFGGNAASELYLGPIFWDSNLNLVFRGDATANPFPDLHLQRDGAGIPRDAFLRLDQRYFTLRAGRLPMFLESVRSIDGAEVTLRPIPPLSLGGYVGQRNSSVVTPVGTIEHAYDGMAYGAVAMGGWKGFLARVDYQGIYADGMNVREDLGGGLQWQIIRDLLIYGNARGSLLLNEMIEGGAGVVYSPGPVTLSGFYKWSDPALLFFDTNDPWIVFASEPSWRTGGNAEVRLLDGALLLFAGGVHGSAIDYGLGGGAQWGRQSFVRADLAYANGSESAGDGDNIAATLTGNLDLNLFRMLASVSYVENQGGMMPLYGPGEAVGLRVAPEVSLGKGVSVGGRFDGIVSDNPFQFMALAFFQYRPEVTNSSPAFWRDESVARASLAQGVAVFSDGLSLVVIPAQVIMVYDEEGNQDAAFAQNLHQYHTDMSTGCTDCHSTVAESLLASDNNTVVDCTMCHSDGRKIAVTLPDPRLIFPHKTHVTDQSIPCEKCHPGVGTIGIATRANLPSMDVCMSCHDQATRCTQCHPASPSGRVQSIFADGRLLPSLRRGKDVEHTVAFMRGGHRDVARMRISYCENCHGESFSNSREPKGCRECHDPLTVATRPQHPAGWSVSHPQGYRSDPTSCRSCHDQSTCQDCHASRGVSALALQEGIQSYHPGGWLGSSGGSHASRAEAGVWACASCHEVGQVAGFAASAPVSGATACASCHTALANPHGSGMQGRLDALKKANPSLCQRCH